MQTMRKHPGLRLFTKLVTAKFCFHSVAELNYRRAPHISSHMLLTRCRAHMWEIIQNQKYNFAKSGSVERSEIKVNVVYTRQLHYSS